MYFYLVSLNIFVFVASKGLDTFKTVDVFFGIFAFVFLSSYSVDIRGSQKFKQGFSIVC